MRGGKRDVETGEESFHFSGELGGKGFFVRGIQ
jgi:hypothetical protein